MRILIVEDDADIARYLLERLSREGHVVAHAPDAISATSRARGLRPDVVLLDLMLPGGGGLLVADRLVRLPEAATARIIIITANEDPAVAREVAARGLVLLGKPFSLSQLREAIEG